MEPEKKHKNRTEKEITRERRGEGKKGLLIINIVCVVSSQREGLEG